MRLNSWWYETFELQDPQHARLLPMEGLRGFAVMLVFLQHYTVQCYLVGLHPNPGLARIADVLAAYGNMGVELFFVLSGYLIYGALLRTKSNFIGFMRRRFERIYPTFLLVFAFSLALIVLLHIPDKIPSGHWQAAGYLAANLALLPGLFPISPMVTVTWSLSYEVAFYFITAALVIGTGLGRKSAKLRIVFLVIITVLFFLTSCADIPYFPVRMMPFFVGMLLAEGLGSRVPSWAGWAVPILGFVVFAECPLPIYLNELVQTVAFFALCATCFRGGGVVSAIMAWTPVRWLGNMSYSYYLLHAFVIRLIMGVVGRVAGGDMPGFLFWCLMPVVFGGTIVASSLLFVWVEKPFSLRPRRLVFTKPLTSRTG